MGDEGIQNLHEPSYEQQYDEPSTSGVDQHLDQLISLELQQDHSYPDICIDNSENVPSTRIKCPQTNTFYEVNNTDLVKFLREKGRKQTDKPKLSEVEIKQLIRRFCIPREMNFIGPDDAKKLVNSGYKI